MLHDDNDSWSWGIPAANLSEIIEYWKSSYDWRVSEEKLNKNLFATTIDGLRIVFKHFRATQAIKVDCLKRHIQNLYFATNI